MIYIYKTAGEQVTMLDGAPPADQSALVADLRAQIAALTPKPAAVPFTTGCTVPVGPELAFSDTQTVFGAIPVKTAASWRTLDDRRGGGYSPGCYYSAHNFRIQWANDGGDWYDLAGVPQGNREYSNTIIPQTLRGYFAMDASDLVRDWCSGAYPNYGMLLLTDGKCALYCNSRFATANPPFLMVNGTRVECGRSTWITPSQTAMAGLAEPTTLQISPIARTLLWFDLSAFKGVPITSAVLSLYVTATYDGPWPMTVKVMRLANPADQSVMPPQEFGIASKYIADAGIAQDPDVIYAHDFTDASKNAEWAKGNEATTAIVTAADGNGFTPLAGLPAIKCTFTPPLMSALQVFIPVNDAEELYTRYGLLLGNDWNPLWNPAGKLPGYDMSYFYPPSFNMGVGHGSSGADGLTGASARMSYDSPPGSNDPLAGLTGVGFGGDYNADSLSASGTDVYFGAGYLNMLRRGQQYTVESHIKLNTVDWPDEIPRLVTSLTCVGTLATATFAQPQTGPLWATGFAWSFGGVSFGDQSVGYVGPHVITVTGPNTCTFTVPAGTLATANRMTASNNLPVPNFLAIPGQGRRDGVLELWVNGRLAGRHTDLRWRHSRLRPDGGIFGIQNVWIVDYTGGRNPPTSKSSLYLSALAVAKSYIGPIFVEAP